MANNETYSNSHVIYQINLEDVQQVAEEFIDRPLTNAEIVRVESKLGDLIDWMDCIERAITLLE